MLLVGYLLEFDQQAVTIIVFNSLNSLLYISQYTRRIDCLLVYILYAASVVKAGCCFFDFWCGIRGSAFRSRMSDSVIGARMFNTGAGILTKTIPSGFLC